MQLGLGLALASSLSSDSVVGVTTTTAKSQSGKLSHAYPPSGTLDVWIHSALKSTSLSKDTLAVSPTSRINPLWVRVAAWIEAMHEITSFFFPVSEVGGAISPGFAAGRSVQELGAAPVAWQPLESALLQLRTSLRLSASQTFSSESGYIAIPRYTTETSLICGRRLRQLGEESCRPDDSLYSPTFVRAWRIVLTLTWTRLKFRSKAIGV